MDQVELVTRLKMGEGKPAQAKLEVGTSREAQLELFGERRESQTESRSVPVGCCIGGRDVSMLCSTGSSTEKGQ